MPSKFKRTTRRVLMLLALIPTAVLILGTLYTGMDYLEGSPRTFLQSLQWAAETLTTTGYGRDNHSNKTRFLPCS